METGEFDVYLKALEKAESLLGRNSDSKGRRVNNSVEESEEEEQRACSGKNLKGNLMALYNKLEERDGVYQRVREKFPESGEKDLVDDFRRWAERQ